jgi:hypothetical protein
LALQLTSREFYLDLDFLDSRLNDLVELVGSLLEVCKWRKACRVTRPLTKGIHGEMPLDLFEIMNVNVMVIFANILSLGAHGF